MRGELSGWDGLVSSALIRVEALPACARYGPEYVSNAETGLDALALVPIDDAVLDDAARLEPATMRSLDAIHLATALSPGDDLGAMFVYDERLADAARRAGVRVDAPA